MESAASLVGQTQGETITMAQPTPAQRMEHVIRTYIQACNDADAAAIAACFCPDAVHYVPSGHKWAGAATIGNNFAQRVRAQGHYWMVDQLLIDGDRCIAALEWTRFNGQQTQIIRGVDWFVFEPQTWCIQEVRPYTAAPVQPDMARQEFLDFDYAGRGYPTTSPAAQTRGEG
jgi:methyltransferase